MIAKSFSKHEQKKLGYGGFICSLFIVFCFFTLLVPYLGPLPTSKSITILHIFITYFLFQNLTFFCKLIPFGFCYAVNLQISMGVDHKMLSLKETNTSQPIFEEKHDLGMTTSNGSRNVNFQMVNSLHNDSETSIKGSENVSLEIGDSTSQHKDWELSTKGSKNVILDIENSTSLHHTDTTFGSIASSRQHSETPSKNYLIIFLL